MSRTLLAHRAAKVGEGRGRESHLVSKGEVVGIFVFIQTGTIFGTGSPRGPQSFGFSSSGTSALLVLNTSIPVLISDIALAAQDSYGPLARFFYASQELKLSNKESSLPFD